MKDWSRWLRWSASVVVLALAGWLLWQRLSGLEAAQLRVAMSSIPRISLAACLLATLVSFLCLAAFERLATQWIAPGRIPRAVAWRTGLVAHAIANTLGFHPVTAPALRLERYRTHGVDAASLAKIVAAVGACVASGVVALLFAAVAWWAWRSGYRLLLAGLLFAAAAATGLFSTRFRHPLPGSRLMPQALLVLAVGLVEMSAAFAAFAVLLPQGVLPQGPALVMLFVSANVLGVLSHAPGGLGVFEATILAAAAPGAHAAVLGSLLAYRVLYNLLPCALALTVLALETVRGRVEFDGGYKRMSRC